jgi:hypothetical protein
MKIRKEERLLKCELAQLVEATLLQSDFKIVNDFFTRSGNTVFYLSKSNSHHTFCITIEHLKCTKDCPCNKEI